MLKALYAIWLREVKLSFRDKPRVASSLFRSALWIFVFGGGLGAAATITGAQVNYQLYLIPGIVLMSVLFTTMFSGFSVIWDRNFGFLKEILVSPVPRHAVLLGKALGITTLALVEALFILLLGLFIGMPFLPANFLLAFIALFLTSMATVGIGLYITSKIDSFEAFGAVVNLIILPLFFSSGALFPLSSAPDWLKLAASLNPYTYAVDVVRSLLLNTPTHYPLLLDYSVLMVFSIVALWMGREAFETKG